MNFIGNILWLLFGGFAAAMGYFFGGLILCFSIIGIPFGIQCFKIGIMTLWPFGKKVINGEKNSGCLPLFLNVLWLLCGGVWLAVIHIAFGIFLFITVIGIPFARQHFKMVELSLMPFGKVIVDKI